MGLLSWFFPSPDAIADAKAEILERADRSDLLVCNADAGRSISERECCNVCTLWWWRMLR